MKHATHKILVGLASALGLLVVSVGVVPQRYIPEHLCPMVTEHGRFEGNPIRLPGPKSAERASTAKVRIQMEQGMCRGRLERDTEATGLFNIAGGLCVAQVPTGSELVLDPQGNTGEYDITIGPEWHLLGPKGRRFVLLPTGFGLMVGFILTGRFLAQARKLGAKRLLFIVGVAVVSGLVLYPALHEGGHIAFGMLLGARPDWKGVVWTCLSGQEPHASFSSLPQNAGPLMSAGGHILPTGAALIMLLIWRLVYRQVSRHLSAVLVLVPGFILLGNLGCLFELHQNTHMDALAVGLGLSGHLRVLLSLSPLCVAMACYLWLMMTFRHNQGPRCHKFIASARSWLILLLLFVLVLPGSGLRRGSDRAGDSSGVWNNDLPQLDSFSEPAVAAAILQQHVQNLFQTYLLTNRPDAMDAAISGPRPTSESDGQAPKQPHTSNEERGNSVRPFDQQSLWALDGRLRVFRSESLQNLLVIHCQQGSWNDLIDTYLELLAVAPERAAMRCWMREALNCSLTCGRTDEVLDALQHVTRFNRNTRLVAWIQGFLEDWNLGRIPGLPPDDGLAPERSPSNPPADPMRRQFLPNPELAAADGGSGSQNFEK